MPDLGLAGITAKIDTGARTSALHAEDLKPHLRDGERWIEFRVPLDDRRTWVACAARITDQRPVKNTSGIPETRTMIETTLVIGHHRWTIEVSLADRTEMALPLILGRTAIRRRRVLVDPGRSFLAGPPVGRIQKKNAGSPLRKHRLKDHRRKPRLEGSMT